MPPNNNEMMLHKLREKITETNDNTFRIQVSRKRAQAYIGENIATLDDASVEMLAAPETWLPKLFGGGTYIIHAMHVSELSKKIGDGITLNVEGDSRGMSPVWLDLIRSADWLGPKHFVWPSEKDLEEMRQAHLKTVVSPPGSKGEGYVPRSNGPALETAQVASMVDPRWASAAQSLEDEKRAWEQKRRELEDSQRKLELENAKREADMRSSKLEAKLEALATREPVKSGPGIMEIVTAITPVVIKLVEGQNEIRKEMLVRDEKAREENNKIFMLMLEKKNDDSPNLKIMSSFAEAFSGLNGMAFEMMHRMREEVFGPPENTAVLAFKEIGKALMAMGGAGGPKLAPQKAPQNVAQLPAKASATKVAKAPKADPVGRIEAMIRAKIDPEIVADALFAGLREPEMQAALAKVGGQYQLLLQERLGDFLADNMEYLTQLGTVIQTKGRALGVFQDAPVEEAVEEPEGEEDAVEAEEESAPEGEEESAA